MRTSPPRTSSGAAGFTFVEMMVVLAVLTVLTVIAVPAFRNVLQNERDRELNRFMATLRRLCTEAVLTRAPRRLEIDLDAQEYRPLAPDSAGRFAPPPEGHPLSRRRLPETLEMTDLVPYGASGPPLTARTATLDVDPSGFIDPFLLHLRESRETWTVRVGFTCKPELVRGHADEPLP